MIAMGVLPSGDEPASAGRAGRSPRRYDDSFRRYAVKRANEPDARLSDVASELGVSASTLRRWVRTAGAGEVGTTVVEGGGAADGDQGVSTRGPAPAESLPTPAASPPASAEPPPAPAESLPRPAASPPAPAGSATASPISASSPHPPVTSAAPLQVPLPAGPSGSPTAASASSLSEAAASTAKATGHDERHVLAMLDAILEMFPRPGGLPLEADLSEPGPEAHRQVEAPADRIPLHPGDDIFPALSSLLPAYRFPIILTGLVAALWVSTIVPATYELRPVAQSLHVLSLVVAFGAVLVIDWHGLLWLAGRRGLTESTRLAAGAGPLIWGGLAGLIATGALLHPNLHSPLTVTKLVLVLAVAWNGAAMSALRRRMAQLPAYVKPVDLPRRDWRLMMTATVISQVGWWGAIIIGFVNSSR
ncbi:transposase [Humibacillus xanthopallidus]|uniref:Transposase n=1 Tax=Humibacillus xanthopallidus TaxID=412689 RepID=A0A543H8A7_9MICO|nr:transposase [Humibacillus xanthopallidus]